jgi:hypothetical protein
MSAEVYLLRRNVMNVLYEIKNRGITIPRIEVRIVDTSNAQKGLMGYAYTLKNIIHIAQKWALVPSLTLKCLVLHEVLHAVKGTQHVDGCPLMAATMVKIESEESIWTAFEKYLK